MFPGLCGQLCKAYSHKITDNLTVDDGVGGVTFIGHDIMR